MPRRTWIAACALIIAGMASPAFAAPPRLEDFANLPAIRDATLSPDGTRVAYITAVNDGAVLVAESLEDGVRKGLMKIDAERFELNWCNWANDKRLLCGLSGTAPMSGRVYRVSRLIAIDADGANMKVLIQNGDAGAAQFQDRILDWTPDEPETVLITLDDDRNVYPSVFELNVHTGALSPRLREHEPILSFTTDAKGNVRLGWGFKGTDLYYFARLDGESEWRRLGRVKVFGDVDPLLPVAVSDANKAYAIGNSEGRNALWEVDLTDQTEPRVVFSHPWVDTAGPVFSGDRRLLGVRYQLDRPFIHYTDEKARAVIKAVDKVTPPGNFNSIVDTTRDEKKFLIQSSSDVDDGTYYVFETTTGKLSRLATAYPELNPAQLGRMRTIAYPAADGTEIPGYLTVPVGLRAEKLPLIVMPHGGPNDRDTWKFDFMRAFLVSRGYAVLQMNFRGSAGYGREWQFAAHQDWGGLTYSDITDGARWAIKEGIADRERICILGADFGGYAALLGAVRNRDLYRCAASIGGISDLHDFMVEARMFTNSQIVRERIGFDRDKLRKDSPLKQVADISMPVLLIHGERDYGVPENHSRNMASALKAKKKPHRAVFIEDATQNLYRKSDRVTVLAELEKFFLENLGPGSTASP